MPRHTEWIQHIPRALSEVQALPSPTIDRRTIQALFHVSPRQAIRILSTLGCYTAGKSLLIERRDLIDKLESLGASPAVRQEQTRHERVSHHLELYRRDQHARHKRIRVQPEAVPQCIASLPSDVSLQRGNLHIQFTTAEDLLAKLFTLAQAISSDYTAFEEAIL